MTTNTIFARLTVAGLAAAISVAALPAQAQEGVAIKNLLGSMGVIPAEKDPIRYRERAPLVLPPKMQLREPTSTGRTAATDPAWPRDADVEAKRRAAAEERRPVTDSEVRRMADRNPTLTQTEMRAGRIAGVQQPTEEEYRRHRGDNSRDVLLLSQEELARGRKAEEPEAAGMEPQRRTLAEPPSGFRKPANGRLATATAAPRVDQQERDANPMTWLTRRFTGANDDE